MKEGEGIITYKDGTKMKMTWRNGKMLKKVEHKEEHSSRLKEKSSVSKRSKSIERSKIRFRTKKKTKK